MPYELIELCYEGDFATITLNHPQRRNALSLKLMLELTSAFREAGETLPTWWGKTSSQCARC